MSAEGWDDLARRVGLVFVGQVDHVWGRSISTLIDACYRVEPVTLALEFGESGGG